MRINFKCQKFSFRSLSIFLIFFNFSLVLLLKVMLIKKACIITRKFTLKNIIPSCFVRSEHCIDLLNAKSIGKKYLNVFIIERFIEQTAYFWDSVKKFRRSHQRCSIKKDVLKNFTIFTGKTNVRVSFKKVEKRLYWKETLIQLFSCEYYEILKNTFCREHLRATSSRSSIWKHFSMVNNLFFVKSTTKQLLWRLT